MQQRPQPPLEAAQVQDAHVAPLAGDVRNATPPSPPRLRPPASPGDEEIAAGQLGFVRQAPFVAWTHPSVLARQIQAHATALLPLLGHWQEQFATTTLDHTGACDLLAGLGELAALLARLDGFARRDAASLILRANAAVQQQVADVTLPAPAVLGARWLSRRSLAHQATFVGLGIAVPGLPAALQGGQAGQFGCLDGTCAPLRQALDAACAQLAPWGAPAPFATRDLALVPAARRAVRSLAQALTQALGAHPL